VGLRDILTGRHEVKGPAPDRLFAISTAYVTLETEHQIFPAGTAAIVFQSLATSEFEATLKEMEELVRATGGDSGTTVTTQDDSYGYRWMVLSSPAGKPCVEDLAVGINAVSGAIEAAGHGDRLLCAVFAFIDRSGAGGRSEIGQQGSPDGRGSRVYFIYNYKRGYWYPLVPARSDGGTQSDSEQQRSTERELQIKAQMSSELPIEPELERWFPLWGIPI
jgi:hypothetical protein